VIILGIRVSNINEIIADFDTIRIYRDTAQDAPFTGPPIGTIQLLMSQTNYEYDDVNGLQTSWYRASYYQDTPVAESDKSLPFQGVPAEGPLGILTPDYIRANTDFPVLAAMSDSKLWNYIWRAESLMYSWSLQYGGFCTDTKTNWNVMSRIAGLIVVEQLYITSDASLRARRVSGVQSEKIGSYSYSLSNNTTTTQTADYQDPYAFGAEALAILGYYTCGTSSMIHMKTTQVFPELAPSPGYVLTPQYMGVEIRPWHDFNDLELRRGILIGYRHWFRTQDPA
jgi:hypothetical protein